MTKQYKKVVMLADVHYGAHASTIEWLENINGYFDNFFMPWLRSNADEDTCLAILGDYFENRQSTDINVMVSAIDNIKRISEIVPVFMLVGNHDIYKKSGLDKSSLSCIENIPNVYVFDDTTDGIGTIELTNGQTITLISWVGDHVKETTLLNEYKKKSPIIFMHTELSGMTYDNGREITEGTVVKLPEGGKIFSGHIHKRQASKSGNIMYIGSPYHLERSDIDNQKGIHVLNVEGDNVNLEFIPNTYSPEYLKMKLTIGEDGKWCLDKDLSKLTNNYVDVEITEEASNAINSNKVAEEMLKYSPKSLTFVPITKSIQINTENIESRENNGVKEVFENTINSIEQLSKEDISYLMTLNDKYIKEASEELGIQY